MSSWYFCSNEIVNSPSRSDGIEITAECRYRREGARFIMDVGNRMNLRYETVATGIVFYHRFYMVHSFKTINRLIGAAACLYLAGKAEETPKKCRDLVKAVRTILSERQMEAFGDDPKEEIISHERLLLQTIKFDLCVQHPYKYIVKFAKNLKDDRAQIEKVVQMAWNFVNDSLSTTLCLQWKPQVVAVSLLHLAAKLSKYNLSAAPDGPHYDHSKSWWQHFLPEINSDVLEDICLQMLDFYDKTDVGASNYNMISPPKITMKDWENARRLKSSYNSTAPKIQEPSKPPIQNNSSIINNPSIGSTAMHTPTRQPIVTTGSSGQVHQVPTSTSVSSLQSNQTAASMAPILFDNTQSIRAPPPAGVVSAVPPPLPMMIPSSNPPLPGVMPNTASTVGPIPVMPPDAAARLGMLNQSVIQPPLPLPMTMLVPPINNLTEVQPGIGVMSANPTNSMQNWGNIAAIPQFPQQPGTGTNLPVNHSFQPPPMNSNIRPSNSGSFQNWMG